MLCFAWLAMADCFGLRRPSPKQPSRHATKAQDFSAGPGRDETFYACTAGHGFKLVAQQRMTARSGRFDQPDPPPQHAAAR
jgi:hypothetical protein